jgi:glucokinase
MRSLLAADVGASKTRLRLARRSASDSTAEVVAETEFESGSVQKLVERILGFVGEHQVEGGLAAVAIGLPGKISEDRRSAAITYLDPDEYVDFGGLFARLGARHALLMNDLECGTRGVSAQTPRDLVALSGSAPEAPMASSRYVLGMPGSGLGIGLHLQNATGLPSEGGHLPAATDRGDEIEGDLSAALGPGLATYEDLTRGPAIPLIFSTVVRRMATGNSRQALLSRLEELPLDDRPRWVQGLAKSRSEPGAALARRSFDYYGRFLGRAMQSCALLLLPHVVFLGGSVVIGTHELFAEGFLASFHSHHVHSGYLRDLPVIVVLNPFLNLDGATEAAWDACMD